MAVVMANASGVSTPSSVSGSYQDSLSTAITSAEATTGHGHGHSHDIDPPTLLLPEDGYLALGTIVLDYEQDDVAAPQLMMRGPAGSEAYPSPWLTAAVRKGWIHLDEIKTTTGQPYSFLQVYALPEDVDRANRGSVKDFRKTVKHLLGFVNRSPEAWLGRHDALSSWLAFETPRTLEEESLFYIFNTLRSPCPNLDCFATSAYGYEAVRNVMSDTIVGLTTDLYPYQRRSVAAMIQREAEPAKILDPRKPICKDIYGRPFYLDIHDGILLRHPPLYTEPQGGILAETMGYGKTLICIALVLATRGHYPKVPEGRIDSVPLRPREKVGSLLAMAARRTKYEGVAWKSEFHTLGKAGYQFNRCMDELKKYEREYAEPIFTPTTPDRKGKRESANIVRLCSATLVIVPSNLLVQWQNEIKKHTEEGSLDVLVIDQPTNEVPPWQKLLTYDIVIITKARFEQEYRDDDLNQGKVGKGDIRYRSALTDVRWLRVICDEGHGFAGSSSRTNAIAMLDKMYIERRWVVSGTPSSTLHGVEVTLSTNTSAFSDSSSSTPTTPEPTMTRKKSLSVALQKRRAPSALDLEAKDLERLRLIVVNFLRLQPWANQRGSSDVANWKKYLGPVTDTNGTRYTSPALREVLQTLIIRHRIEDIDTDLTLPPLHNKVIYLEPSYHDKLAINMFFLVLSSNYVTSEREDEDYMFHPRNRKKLDQLIYNLRQASFHWVGFSGHDIRETLRISNDYLNNNIDKVSDADGVLLTEAILNGERALSDPSWKAFATLHEIGVYVEHFPDHAREAWALDGRDENPVLLGTVQAREAQRYFRVGAEGGAADCLSGLAGAGVRAMHAARSRAEEDQKVQQNAKARSHDSEKQQVGTIEAPKLKSPSVSSASPARSLPLKKRKRRDSSVASPALLTPPSSPAASLKPYLAPSPYPVLSGTTIHSFTSSKLTYLTSRILSLPPSTKSMVFYQHNNTAFFIAEALELLSIPFRIYANTLSVAQRNAYLAEFNSESSDLQVLLMDVKQASHGLHIACASYVCIVSPIWDAGVESQAIKRAHRIGQTKEVVVETLVLKGTFEEEMVRRRKWKDEHFEVDAGASLSAKDQSNEDSTPPESIDTKRSKGRNVGLEKSLLDDGHMVNVIKDIKFLKFNKGDEDGGGRSNEMSVSRDKRLLFAGVLANSTSSTNNDARRDGTETTNPVHGLAEPTDSSDLRVKFRKLRT